MLDRVRFDYYHPGGPDPLADMPYVLRLDDLPPRFEGKPKVSYLMSTYNRKAQLARSLECLCRQEFREFEVLLMDDGSTQDLSGLWATFMPRLRMQHFRTERTTWHSCPSRAFKAMLPACQGEVIAIAHPEMMLAHEAMRYLYEGGVGKLADAKYWIIDHPIEEAGPWRWVSLKPGFVPPQAMVALDGVDWHTEPSLIRAMVEYNTWGPCFAGHPNPWHAARDEYPWWFVGAARRDCPIWTDMHTTDGHGVIDMWLCAYRSGNRIVDVTPEPVLCWHQAHQTSAVAPAGEAAPVLQRWWGKNVIRTLPDPRDQRLPSRGRLRPGALASMGEQVVLPSTFPPGDPRADWLPEECEAGAPLYSVRVRRIKRSERGLP